jgi:hypothetical protein
MLNNYSEKQSKFKKLGIEMYDKKEAHIFFSFNVVALFWILDNEFL